MIDELLPSITSSPMRKLPSLVTPNLDRFFDYKGFVYLWYQQLDPLKFSGLYPG